ncbi:hypothetical protein DYD21_07775 [Rhodohalobacter sp. SW132]|uniref:PQQ-dependent sugar dehydrogenase n=1 Tax=Rhodohalobacter sp. SW132 TaxID=2293433 RepID=UPI000E22603F|nr:PQQ-dependent sugar dehydrogenase [Rhodohalobacter sp. SW132]REL37674.1 hypothetical protein DYD21_07775 [Rhodohalobacter sp. SW132]
MKTSISLLSLLFIIQFSLLHAQTTTNDPFPDPLIADEDVILVGAEEFAELPDYDGNPVRMMLMVDEPGTSRMFVNDMYGPIYSVSYDGEEVSLYVNINDPEWGVGVEYRGRERGFQSFAFHPDFGREGSEGYGRFYTFSDVRDNETTPDFIPNGGDNTHHTVLHEWIADDPSADRFDGEAPRELMRFEQPFGNHNAGLIAFHPFAEAGSSEYGLLYIGSADGGSGGDPLNLSLDLTSAFGKMLRIDPLGSNSENGQYGIPDDNPWAGEEFSDELGEIYAYGMRNPQRFGWDPDNNNLFMADIGQNIVEKVSLVPKGGNLGWNEWEGSYRFVSRSEVIVDEPRSDPDVVYPVVEYGRYDPLMANRVAVTGIHVYRDGPVSQLMDLVLFGDMVNGEIFYFDADNLPEGGTEGLRRVLLHDENGDSKTYLELIQDKNREQNREPASRTDLRFGTGPDNMVFLLNKQDGTIRVLTP